MTTTTVTLAGAAPAPSTLACAHCGLPVPAARLVPRAPSFCCDGCATVYTVLNAGGLTEWYARRDADGAAPRPARVSHGRFTELDDPKFQEHFVHALPGGTACVELAVENLHCSACVWLLERLPRIAPGVEQARVDRGRETLHLVFDPERTRLSEVARTLDSLGYRPHAYRGHRSSAHRAAEQRSLIARMGVAFASAGNVMLLAFALYGGEATGIEPAFESLFRWLSLGIALPGVFGAGSLFFRGAVASLRTGVPHLDLPIAIGLLAGTGVSALHVVQGQGAIYFDTLTVLVFLLLVGRWLVQKQRRRAEDASALLLSLAPTMARRVTADGTREEVFVEALARGEHIEVRSGERVPADAVVVQGESSVDASWLTGESLPRTVVPGDTLEAGTVLVAAPVVAEVTATGAATRLGRLVSEMEASAARRAPVVTEAQRLSHGFTVTVLAAAALTALVWLFRDPAQALSNTLALLVVTCPCALGMATPLAVTAALGKAARRGILVRGGDALEALARPARVVLDKTGTLTLGRLTVLEWQGLAALRPLVAALEMGSAHPVARALADGADPAAAAQVESRAETPGGGVRGTVSGTPLVVGTARYLEAQGVPLPEAWQRAAERAAAEGRSPVLVAARGEVAALAVLGDEVRPEARAALARLCALGHELLICSGDHPAVVRRVAEEVGVDVRCAHGGMSPEQKLALVESLRRERPVVMVGDGVNDAAALAAATAGVAVHGGAEASLQAADAFARREGLLPVVELLEGARRTLGVIRRGLGFSLLYNVVGASLAALGLMNPLVAAVLMPLSSLTVVSHAFRSRTFPEEPAS